MNLPEPQPDWALFLDFDGSVIELADRPEEVRVDLHLPNLLVALSDVLGGAMAVVSGRPLAQLDRLLSLCHLPAAGIHGLERRRADGTVQRTSVPEASLSRIRRELEVFARAHRGLVVEDKGVALALHYRRAPDAEQPCRRIVERLAHDLGPSFKVLEGKHVFEIKPAGADKGRAIAAFLREPPFVGRVPVFCGDDITDEDGFALVNRRGGLSIRVGDGAQTLARWRVASVGELVAWLETIPRALVKAGQGGRG